MNDMKEVLEKAWYRSAPWLCLLVPLSKLFSYLAARRRRLFQQGKRQVYQASVPVIVIGNISVGGTGKTPLTIALAEKLMAAGFRPGIVSRGYGSRSSHFPLVVTADTDASLSGDEALLLARNLECPIVIDPDRPAACRLLLQQFPHCNVILSDDGLQHYALARDIEIAVIDGKRGLGNGRQLPAGPLREPESRLNEVDFIVFNGDSMAGGVIGEDIRQSPKTHVMNLVETELVDMLSNERHALSTIERGQKVHAIAGIGNPQRFFDSLSACGFAIIAHVFPDHHAFRLRDIQFDDKRALIMTEKDAVKCQGFAAQLNARQVCYLKVAAHLSDAFFDAVLNKLGQQSDSSKNGKRLQQS